MSHAIAAAGAGFLMAVLWFDLMFDVQIARHRGAAAPAETLASIARYYRRVTTEARPMNRLIPFVMLATLGGLAWALVESRAQDWRAWLALVLALSAIGLAMARTVRNAVRLGAGADAPELQTALARAIYRDHLYCLAAMGAVLALQLAAFR